MAKGHITLIKIQWRQVLKRMNKLYAGFVEELLNPKPVISSASVALIKIKLRCVFSKLHRHGLRQFNIKEAEETRPPVNYSTARPFPSAS
jgi:hypothetical protein